MANFSATYSGDLTSYIAGKIFDAANMAKEERERAIEEAKKYDVDPQLRRGEFFGRALQSQFGGDLYNRTVGIFDPRKSKPETDRKSTRERRYSSQFRYPDRFMRGQSVVDPLIGTPAHVRNLPEYQQLASKEEKNYKAKNKPLGQTTDPESMFNRDKPVKVRDQKLGVFLAAVTESINSSINDINKRLDETESSVIEAKEGIAGTVKQLEYNADTLEEKLDAIIAALRDQIRSAKKQSDTAEIRDKAREIKQSVDLSGTERVVKPDEDPNKVRQLNLLEDAQDAGGQLSLPLDDNKDGFERGGIATGPDSGYLAPLHGNEMIIPLDNNYTQGQPSAIDGKIRPKPKMDILPKYEMGTTPEQGNVQKMDDMFSKVIPSVIGKEDRNKTREETEKLYGAMQLPIKATGLVTLGLLQNSLGMMGPIAGAVAPMIKVLSSPIASSFGVPDTVTDKVVKQQETEIAEKTRRQAVQSAPSMSAPTSGSQSSSGSGFQWWNPLSWFRGNNNTSTRRGGTGGPGSGIFNRISNFISNPLQSIMGKPKPKGLAGASLKRIMHGTAEGVPDLIRQNGFRGQTGMLGSGVYGSVKGWVADTYRGAGKWKGILPGQGPRLDMLVPQASRTLRGATVVSERQANRGLRIAEGILSGKYTGPKAQALKPLLMKATPTMGQAFGQAALGGAKLGGKLLGILGPILDVAFPDPTAQYDQLTGPNAYYNAPGYKGPKPQPFAPPQTRSTARMRSNFVSMQSREAALSRLDRSSNNLDPIVINNMQQASAQREESVPIRAIATVGNHGLNQYYPAPY